VREASHSIIVVDDEKSIREALSAVLEDEGFHVVSVDGGEAALRQIKEKNFDLCLLDIWMPGKDGMVTLDELKKIRADLPVIMISGHATIATAISATKRGASDVLEKPIDLDQLLRAVNRVISCSAVIESHAEEGSIVREELTEHDHITSSEIEIKKIVFEKQNLRGPKVVQKTLARSAMLYGQGLHSGKKSGLIFEPLPPNSGIHFVGITDYRAVPAHVDYVGSTGFATTVKLGSTQVGTIEHLMSALRVYGISNLLIKCNGEVPVLDGSAIEFCKLFDAVGVVGQSGDWYAISLPDKVEIGNDRELITIEPADYFEINYHLDYPEPLGVQHFTFRLDGVEQYKKEISSARTFGFLKDVGALQKQGLAQGGRFDNFVLFGDKGPLNCNLRYPNEAVRHKVLDAIGDLYLLGRPILGKVTAKMTGHSDNIRILNQIRALMLTADALPEALSGCVKSQV
jgi:UDP-3-O-acyl N-acetylglucosamine deacetylase